MTRTTAIVSGLACLFAISTGLVAGDKGAAPALVSHRVKYRPLRFSGKEHFPTAENELIRLRDELKKDAMRAHAWRLFAGLTNAESAAAHRAPIWDSWYTECDVQLMKCPQTLSRKRYNTERLLNNFSIPAQNLQSLELAADRSDSDLATAIKNVLRNDPQLASVLYNKAAKEHILNNHLYSPAHLDEIRQARLGARSPEAEREIPSFPADSVILKTAWELIYPDPNSHNEFATVDIWNPEKEKNDSRLLASGYKSAREWGKSIRVDLRAKKRTQCKDGDYKEREDVPLGCFYYVELTPKLSDYWYKFARAVGDDSPHAAHPIAVLMAVHVTTKEIGDWVWATFWWYNMTTYPGYGCDDVCRSILKGNKWRHFLMDTTFSGNTPLECDLGHKICFNRYIEEKMPYGIVSNCIQCHRRAVYRPKGRDECAYTLGALPRCTDTEEGKLKKCSDIVPCACSQNDKDYYTDSLQTDFLWTIADVNESAKQKVQAALIKLLNPPPAQ